MPTETRNREVNELVARVWRERENLNWMGEIDTVGLNAYIYALASETGSHRIAGIDDYGRRFSGTGKYEDPQSDSPGDTLSSHALTQDVPTDDRCPQDIAGDVNQPLNDRVSALHEWVVADNDSAASFVLSELEANQTDDQWLAEVVFAAEDVRFPQPMQQDRAAIRLRSIADNMRNRCDAEFEQAVFSAVRRFASLVAKERADGLVDFLTHVGSIDTRLVALQCVGYIFEDGPPSDVDTNGRLRDRLAELANKLLDGDVLVPGETSAMAEQTVNGLAATGDLRLEVLIARVKCLNLPGFSGIVYRNLSALHDGWVSVNAELRRHVADQQIVRILDGWE